LITWDNETALRAFLKDHPFKYQMVPNAGHLILGAYSDGTGSVVFPTHVIIDKEGKITMRVTGDLVTKAGTKKFKVVRKAIARLADVPFKQAK
jgi:peroxiredoxin